MALGVAAADTVLAAGQAAGGWAPGDAVMTHPVPLRGQGTWAPRLIAPAGLLARRHGQRGTRRRRQRDPGGRRRRAPGDHHLRPPRQQRGITVFSIYVRADGNQLRNLARQFGDGQLEIPVAASYSLTDAAQATGGHAARAIALTP
jgi:hypothetical protein